MNKITSPQPIKAALAMRRITVRKLSTSVQCNPHTLGRVINGYVEAWPSLRQRCSDELGIPIEELFEVGAP